MAVLGLHASYGNFPGGFLGVDVFFALSGYLITSNLLADVERSGKVDFHRFYIRRLRRLAPALCAALVLTGLLWPLTGAQVSFGSAALPALFYYANWKSALAGPSSLGALAHSWSLSIEEQFYLLWPAGIAVLVSRRKPGSLRAIAVTGAIIVVLAISRSILRGTGSVLASYNSTFARIDELLIGSLFALTQRALGGRVPGFGGRISNGAACLAIVAIGWMTASAHANDVWLYRGGFTLIAVAATIVVLEVTHAPQNLLARALSLSPLVELGKRSYGIYLYHFPLFLAVEQLRVPHSLANFVAVSIVRLTLTLAVAWMSYRWIEEPLHARKQIVLHPSVSTTLGERDVSHS
jgi:peptidoglycan/LPS O-acetylase OafA/YrhL